MVTLISMLLLSAIDCVEGTPQEVTDKYGILTEFTVAPNKHGQCLPHGEWNEFYTNPRRPRKKSTYLYGVLTGPFKMWFENGKQSKSGAYDKNGLETGLWVYYHKNGERWQAGEYRQGKQHGLWISWYLSGIQQSETRWVDGKLHGKTLGWYSNGQKAFEVIYEHGHRREEMLWGIPNKNPSKIEDVDK